MNTANDNHAAALVARFPAVREEQRVVALLDLVGSTGIAERLGAVRYHAFLSAVFFVLARVLDSAGGRIHRSVGDTLIATWPLGSGAENARAVEAIFAAQDALAAMAPQIVWRFGERPAFRAALHCGPVVAARIAGTGASDIVGDGMNVAARIEQVARAGARNVVASRDLMTRVALPFAVTAASIGSRALRGRAGRTELYALTPAQAGASLFRACA